MDWWRAEAANTRERRVAQFRRIGLVLLAALVLLPPKLVALLVVVLGAVYICIVVVRASIRPRDVS